MGFAGGLWQQALSGHQTLLRHAGQQLRGGGGIRPKLRARGVDRRGKRRSGLAPFRRSGGRYMQGDLREVWFYPEDLAGHTESTKVLVRR
jgi:hypothetical protein